MARNLDYWRDVTRWALRTSALTAEQIEAVAAHAFAEDEAGRLAAVWHSVAQVMGFPERCQCVQCASARGERR